MNQDQTAQLRGLLAMYAAYFRQTIPDVVLVMYADDLSDLAFEEVKFALENYRKNPKNRFLPLPAQIRDLLEPEIDDESQAREIAARISGAVVKYGYPNSGEARLFIGEIGWDAVERRGGWAHLCQQLGATIDPTTFEAQLREQVKSAIKYGDHITAPLALCSGVKRGELQSVGEILSQLGPGNKKKD